MKKLAFLIYFLSFLFFINNSKAQISGCTDPLATNFNPLATLNDGSCVYNTASVTPISTFNLGSSLVESSGLISWNNHIWSHNDNSDINIYTLDTLNGNLIQSYPLTGTLNHDWEEISQDSNYVYMGDFGNNQNGNRTNLCILRINKNSLLTATPLIDSINFSYSNQTNFTATGSNNTDFDCEAFIVADDSIYLFNKQWVSNKTSIYSLPKTSGTYCANYKATLDVQGLITSATYQEAKKLVVLTGYSTLLQPFLYLLYDFKNSDYFGANKRKISISLPFHQVEGIATNDGLKYYISNEYFTQPPYITVPQQMHILDLSPYLGTYLNPNLTINTFEKGNSFAISPNPASNFIDVKTNNISYPVAYVFMNQLGQEVFSGNILNNNFNIDISKLKEGLYMLKIGEKGEQSFKLIKK